MIKNLLILPHQLFEIKYLPKKSKIFKVILWEHPHYFKKYIYNKKKLLLHRASMQYYKDYLIKHGYDVRYMEFNDKPNLNGFIMFDPIDRIHLPKAPSEILETPNFLIKQEKYQEYRQKTKHFFFNSFYMWSKQQLNIIPHIKSQDKQNRKKMPNDIIIPSIPSNIGNKQDEKYINEAKKYVDKHFSENYGNTDDFIFPITHKTVLKWLKLFIKNKLSKFGDYQDAISKTNNTLFHSLLSSSINIGLIQPNEIMKLLINKDGSPNKQLKVSINNLEGYIRQLFWREYQRYCYIFYNFKNKNYFGNNVSITKDWYNGKTGILPVDNCIKKGFNTGYLHHIERLMIMGNWMNLSGIKPMDGYKWFMEFSCDSYEWVMHQNVLEMVFFISGGDTMRRPYISSSNYILNMSDYSKKNNENDWIETWDKYYHKFIDVHKDKLWKYRYYFPSI